MPKQRYTPWGEIFDRNNPLPEYPRPQLRRDGWLNLNGVWDYAITKNDAVFTGPQGEIVVPFSPESLLSGVNRQLQPDETLHYRRKFHIDETFIKQTTLLHFGAVDDACRVWINGQLAGGHQGGFMPFALDVSALIKIGENEIRLAVTDPTDTGFISRGKQSSKPGGIWYTPQSGIWQTVWLESVPQAYIASLRMTPDIDRSVLRINPHVEGSAADPVVAEVFDGGRQIARVSLTANSENEIPIPNPRLWSPEDPYLYDIRLTIGEDRVQSYFGMRKFSLMKDGAGILRLALNNKPYFHNGLLDQGYWSDGLLTPPSDEAMLYDIRKMKALGFNMLRKHIKIEPPRWYYHCDKEGMLVWQDMINGGEKYNFGVIGALPFAGINLKDTEKNYKKFGRLNKTGRDNFYSELDVMIRHLYNSVSISVWVPFNEGWGQFDALKAVDFIRERDDSRLIDHASGWHDQSGGDMKSPHVYFKPIRLPKTEKKRATVLSEFGGYSHRIPGHIYNPDKNFGYKVYKTLPGFSAGYQKLFEKQIIPSIAKGLSAAVYTQVSDVEEETNGLLTFDRKVCKLDIKQTQALNAQIRL
ncbi:MAG: glycoside hydrolase family 2 [Oscillospiraceae bacterium]|nr:glycoside hydrolase family 2 [Oscillospiraceae bacterium]